MKMSEEIQDMINENLVHLATTSGDGIPNVVPVGGIRAIGESELLIADVLFDKTKKELVRKNRVADEAPGKRAPMDISLKDRQRSSQTVRSSKGWRRG